jgi:hypothetical protein
MFIPIAKCVLEMRCQYVNEGRNGWIYALKAIRSLLSGLSLPVFCRAHTPFFPGCSFSTGQDHDCSFFRGSKTMLPMWWVTCYIQSVIYLNKSR